MEPQDIQQLWNSAANQPNPSDQRELLAVAKQKIARDRRLARAVQLYLWIVMSATLLFVATQLANLNLVKEAGPLFLMLLAQLAAAVALNRSLRLRQQAGAAPADSIHQTLQTLLKQTEARCQELKLLLGLFVAFVPLCAFAIWSLLGSGKMRPNEAASAGLLAAAILVTGCAWFTYELTRKRQPELRTCSNCCANTKAKRYS